MNPPEPAPRAQGESPVGGLPALLAALKNNPTAQGWYDAGRAALDLKNYPLAVRLLEASLRHDPHHVKAAYGLCRANFCLGAFEEADRACRRALDIDEAHFPSLLARGHLSAMLGDPDEASRFLDAAFASQDRHDDLESGLVHLRLARGDQSAWTSYAPGGRTDQLGGSGSWTPPAERVWRGEVDRDATVCIYKDGGNGDVFLFSRFVPLVAERVREVFLAAPASHDRLLASLPGLSGVVRLPDDLPDARYVHLWSLPGILGDSRVQAATAGYLRAPAAGPSLAHLSGFRVGLTWAGHPNTPINPDRSVPSAEHLGPLLDVEGVDWVSLQFGYRAGESASLPFAARPAVADFGDTAHILSQLDLVITVDTAVANLAGALGTPAWVMVPTYPEFRWGLHGDRTPWYPHLRLFRRSHTREWEGVIQRVSAALREHIGMGKHAAATTGDPAGQENRAGES
jgi:tetratricopeptide (TPR) repeat protein